MAAIIFLGYRDMSHLHLIDEIDGTPLGLIENAPNILADDADTDQLHSPEEKDGDHQCGESLHRLPPYDGLGKDVAHVKESQHGDGEPQ